MKKLIAKMSLLALIAIALMSTNASAQKMTAKQLQEQHNQDSARIAQQDSRQKLLEQTNQSNEIAMHDMAEQISKLQQEKTAATTSTPANTAPTDTTKAGAIKVTTVNVAKVNRPAKGELIINLSDSTAHYRESDAARVANSIPPGFKSKPGPR